MKTPRPTLAMGLLLVAVLAIGLAAMRSPTLLWTQVTITAAVTTLLIATVGALVGSPRSFWVGFALVGWSYLMLSLGPWCSEHVAPWLLSTRIIDEVYARLVAPEKVLKGVGLRQTHEWDGPALDFLYDFEFLRFRRIGHALGTIVHGVLGGIAGIFLAGQQRAVSQ